MYVGLRTKFVAIISYNCRRSFQFEEAPGLHSHTTERISRHPADTKVSHIKTGFVGVLENLENPGILFWHFQDWKVLEKSHWSWKVLEIC